MSVRGHGFGETSLRFHSLRAFPNANNLSFTQPCTARIQSFFVVDTSKAIECCQCFPRVNFTSVELRRVKNQSRAILLRMTTMLVKRVSRPSFHKGVSMPPPTQRCVSASSKQSLSTLLHRSAQRRQCDNMSRELNVRHTSPRQSVMVQPLHDTQECSRISHSPSPPHASSSEDE